MKQQEINKIFGVCFALLFSAGLALPLVGQAAELKFDSQAQQFGVNQMFQVDLMVDTKNQNINAIESEIIFPNELELKEIRDGDSIISFWIDKPRKTEGGVIFSGIIPGGFEGVLGPYHQGYEPGKILSLIFQTKKDGNGIVDLKNTRVLLNDGLGTPAQVSISSFTFEINPLAEFTPSAIAKDNEIPEIFTPEITRDPNVFDNKWFLVFVAQDKGSGVDHYEILENRKQKIENRKWIVAESPYLLKDQKLKSYVSVKAVDKTGNERIVILSPQKPLLWYENYLIWGTIILGVLLAILIGYILWRIKRKKSFSV